MKHPVHFPSAFAGAVLLAVVAVAVSAAQSGAIPTPLVPAVAPVHVTIDGPVHVLGVPAPSEMMQISDGVPFVVPSGKVFVLTALGQGSPTGFDVAIQFKIDGQEVLGSRFGSSAGTQGGYHEGVLTIPPGIAAAAGSTIVVSSSPSGYARGWGYLSDM